MKRSTKKLIFGFATVLPISYVLGLLDIWPFRFKEELTPTSIIGAAVLYFVASMVYDYFDNKKKESKKNGENENNDYKSVVSSIPSIIHYFEFVALTNLSYLFFR